MDDPLAALDSNDKKDLLDDDGYLDGNIQEEEDISDLLMEHVMEPRENACKREFVVVRPSEGEEFTRDGNRVFVGKTWVGVLQYYIHWTPPSYAATCKIHDDCYCTADFDRVDESDFVRWLGIGHRYLSAADHLKVKPCGSYNRRKDRQR